MATLALGIAAPTVSFAQGKDPVAHATLMMPRIDAHLAKQPNDPVALYAKAQASLALGRPQEAREAYRKAMAVSPNNPRLQLEAARLDDQLNNQIAAKLGYSELLKRTDVPPQMRAQLSQRVATLEEATRRHKTYGSISFGLRAQSNANSGPDREFVDIWGLQFQMGAGSMPQSDLTASVTSRFGYSYRLNDQGDTFGASASVYAARPSDIKRNRRDVAELRFGPEFGLKRFGMNGSMGVQALLTHSRSAGYKQFNSKGLSLYANWSPTPKHRLSVALAHRDEDHARRPGHLNADERDNRRTDINFGWSYAVRPDLMLKAGFSHEHRSASADWYSTRSNSISMGVSKRYASPVSWSKGNWNTGLRLSATNTRHKAPDPMVSITKAERTNTLQLDLDHTMPLAKNLNAHIGLSAVRSNSNYDTSTWSDRSVSLSVTYAF